MRSLRSANDHARPVSGAVRLLHPRGVLPLRQPALAWLGRRRPARARSGRESHGRACGRCATRRRGRLQCDDAGARDREGSHGGTRHRPRARIARRLRSPHAGTRDIGAAAPTWRTRLFSRTLAWPASARAHLARPTSIRPPNVQWAGRGVASPFGSTEPVIECHRGGSSSAAFGV